MEGQYDQYGNQKLEICAYETCNSYFLPTKRFAQKYCCESCRVMAYRLRKYGDKTSLAGKYDRATNKDLSDQIASLKKDFDNFQTGSIIGGGAMIILQLVQLAQSGSLKDLTKEQQSALGELKAMIETSDQFKIFKGLKGNFGSSLASSLFK
jgi:hypothetical protein